MYNYPLYRPPSESNSIIIQVTEGCSHNKCNFCTMYKNKSFIINSLDTVEKQIEYFAKNVFDSKKVFLADGNVLCLSVDKLVSILDLIKIRLPYVERISSYAGPKDLIRKTREELKIIKESGLDMLYIGVESGNDKILKGVNKGVNQKETIEGLLKAKEEGFVLSIMLISGLGGKQLLEEHSKDSAKVINEINPDYLSFLTLLIENENIEKILENNYNYESLTPEEILEETKLFLENTELEKTVFRMNHASNYLELKGILNKDKNRLINQINESLKKKKFKPNYLRGL